VGYWALRGNTAGRFNVAVGSEALKSNTTGDFNTALGYLVLNSNNTGFSNTAVGKGALTANTSGHTNTAVGVGALSHIITGGDNLAIGNDAGAGVNGSNNIYIGALAPPANDTNAIRIGDIDHDTFHVADLMLVSGTSAMVTGIHSQPFDAGSGVPVHIDDTKRLGTVLSSRRYKEDIQPLGDFRAALAQLRPVSFRYKKADSDGSKPLQYGLIAEDVAEVLPDLAVFNKDSLPETVKYHLLPTLLLAEHQQQEQTITAQEDDIADQTRQIAARAEQIETLTARDQQQAESIATLEQRLLAIEVMLARGGKAAALQ
jgi:hypothetical protein